MTLDVVFNTVDKISRSVGNIGKSASKLSGTLTKFREGMIQLNKSIESFGRMGQATEDITAPYREFGQSMVEFSSITGIAGNDLIKLGEVARKTGVDSGLGAKGAVEAFALLASQIDVSKIGLNALIGLQKEAITLTQAAGITMDESANAITGTINQFGLQATEANRVINILAAGSKYGAASIPDLAKSFNVVGVAANAAGLSIEDTAGVIEVLSKSNLKGTEAGTEMRNIMFKMQTTLGVDFTKTSFADALDSLKPKMKDVAYMSKVFGIESMATAQFLIANSDSVKEMTDRVTATNVAVEQATTNTNTWNFALDVQAARINENLMQITENNKGLFSLIQTSSQYMRMIASFAPIFQLFRQGAILAYQGVRWLTSGVELLSGKSRLAAAGIWLKNTAMKMGAFVSGVWYKSMALLGPALKIIGQSAGSLWKSIITNIVPAFLSAMSATWAWTVALLANPITWIVAGVMALVGALIYCWNTFEGFRAVIYTIWDTVVGFGQALWDFVVTPFEAAWGFVKGIGDFFGTLFSGGDLEEAGAAFGKSFNEGVDKSVGRIKSGVNGVITTATSIDDNYDRHLAEETKKQKEKETNKSAKKTPDTPTIIPEITGFTMPQGVVAQNTLAEAMTMPPMGDLSTNSSAPNVNITFNPTVNISGDMSAKSREDFLSLLRSYGSDIARLVEEELRKSQRSNYAISTAR